MVGALRDRLKDLDLRLRSEASFRARGVVDRHWRNDSGRRRTLRVGVPAMVLLLVGAGVGGYVALRERPVPDFGSERLDVLFDYTMLSDEFNRLPVEKRLELMGALVKRLKSMSASDSMLMAAFAGGIAGQAREQIERNASRLAIDVWDKYAKDYARVPEGEREAYLEQTYVEFSKIMEAATGNPRDVSDDDRVGEARRQAKRDQERMGESGRAPDGESLGRFFGFMNNNVGGHASPQQRVRGQQMMRDMSRHFRGQDVGTGKNAAPAANGPG